MKSKLLLSALILLSTFAFRLSPCTAQVPLGFNYQAIARDGSGAILPNTALPVKITIQTSTGTVIYEELFSSITTNQFGLISLVVGTGVWQSGSAPNFSAIDWKAQTLFLKTTIQYPGSTWTVMGTSQIWGVPYSLLAKDVQGPLSKLGITGTTDVMDEALFEVKNKKGNTVFAVYNEGIRAYVGDGSAKGVKGGFSVGGYDAAKSGTVYDIFVLSTDSARLYLDSKPKSVKGAKGGFSVGGYDMTKGVVQNYLQVSKDSVRVYVDSNPATKGVKGGFSVGGYDMTKGGSVSNYLNIETNSTGIVNPAENRILWYPLKNAFITGRVLITDPLNVGINSFATGYEPKAKGDYSQAMGYQPFANGVYSTAIGKNAYAAAPNSFSFGDSPQALGNDSYAFGAGAIAQGTGSFAFGSVGRDTTTLASTGVFTSALGNYSFAIGQGSRSTGIGSMSFGMNNTSAKDYSISVGYNNMSSGYLANSFGANNVASGWYSSTIGFMNTASGDVSLAIGHTAKATGISSIAIGDENVQFMTYYAPIEADGNKSVAIGHGVTASSFASFVIGQQNEIPSSFSATTWVATDPLFVIGNGMGGSSLSGPNRSNAMMVLKNGNVGLGTSTPAKKLEVNGDALFDGNAIHGGYVRVVGAPSPIYTGSDNQGLYIGWNKSGNTGEANFVNQIGGGSGGFTFDNVNGLLYHARLMTILGSGNVGIGTSSPGYTLEVNGSVAGVGAYVNTSDVRFKKDIEPITGALEKVMALQGITFDWNRDTDSGLNFDDRNHLGFAAQDLEKVVPQVVSTAKDKMQTKSVAYGDLVPLLTEAIKEQQRQIELQKQENLKMKTELQSMKEEMDQIKVMMKK